MTGPAQHRPLPAIKGEHALVAEADIDQALVDGLHQLLVDGNGQAVTEGSARGLTASTDPVQT